MQIPPEITEQVMALVATVIAALIAWLMTTIRSKVQNEYVRGSMLRLTDAVENAVRAVGYRIATDIREASSDGTITSEEATFLREKAFEYVKLYLGENGTKEAEKIVGADELKSLVFAMVEAQLHKRDGQQPVQLETTERP